MAEPDRTGKRLPLQLISSDLHKSKNASAHRTNDYMSNDLIVRRGQPFTIELHLNRPVETIDHVSLKAETGNSPSGSKHTSLVMPLSSSSSGTSWTATSSSISKNSLNVTIKSAIDAIIGRYRLSLQFSSEERTTTKFLGDFIVLFNPWASEEVVYMESVAEKNEYVLNENGVIFQGSSESPRSRPWDFGQFERDILEASLKLLDSSLDHRRDPAKDLVQRNDPIYVGRVLSAMVNSNNDDGVVVGNWSGDYTGGEIPTKWNGSVHILRQWKESGPVRFGQCWVYAGVLCTVLRSLGIPARVITNFNSAHDTDRNLNIDRYYNEDGTENTKTADSVWNFHAWVEGWFARKDLGSTRDGWQVLDATPQEKSKGLYRLGPCSVKAVKEGDVDLQYDVPFVFAELNADTVDWLVYPDGSKVKIHSNTHSVGKLTSTKAVGSRARADVTNNYKYAEGTPKEREIFMKAQKKLQESSTWTAARDTVSLAAADAEPAPKPDFYATFKQSSDTLVGQDVTLTLTVKNTSANNMSLRVKMIATAIVYTNASVNEILTQDLSVALGPNEEQNLPLTIAYDQYGNAITPSHMIKVVAMCVDENGGNLLVETVIALKNPPIVIKVTEQAFINKPLHLEIEFTNPIAEDVENSVMTVDGSGLVKEQIKIDVPLLKKDEKFVTEVDIIPYRTGQRCIIVDFWSDKFFHVKGSLPVNVAED
ncbi:protein-glutamine gamma-glutamyltransferase E-like [Mixophyes fleayi]|uniref:protein-glutamine gamma-glutamyltransferase E-like n=1 Tax=Mixophyes fleayi TaxID=3061075 RepID=UPI003F4D9939